MTQDRVVALAQLLYRIQNSVSRFRHGLLKLQDHYWADRREIQAAIDELQDTLDYLDLLRNEPIMNLVDFLEQNGEAPFSKAQRAILESASDEELDAAYTGLEEEDV